MSAVSREKANLVYQLYGGKCAYCHRALKRHEATVDHWLPKAMGGGNGVKNLRLACWKCNNRKGSLHPDEWAKWIASQAIVTLPPARESRVDMLARCAPRFRKRKELQAQPSTIDLWE